MIINLASNEFSKMLKVYEKKKKRRIYKYLT